MNFPDIQEDVWVDWYEAQNDVDMSNVHVAVDDECLIYHSPMEIPSTTDMDTITIREASKRGAEPCGQCFNGLHRFHKSFINTYIGKL